MKSYIECVGITASINGYKVLQDVNIKIDAGKIYGVVGQNGSGKSTFSQILSGHKVPDAGELVIDGHKVQLNSVSKANNFGIFMIQQTPQLLEGLSVYENIHLNLMSSQKHYITIDEKKMKKRASEIFEWIGVDININSKIGELKYFEQQIVEFAKVAICKPDLLILDEPTCSLMDNTTDIYLNAISKLNKQGTTIIFISHRLSIINRLAEKVFIVKDKSIKFYDGIVKDENLFDYMIEDKNLKKYPKINLSKEEVHFEIRNLTSANNKIENINLTVRKGEIIGVTGLYGSGKSSIANVLFGIEPYKSGEMYLNGKEIPIGNAKTCIDHGIGYIHENIKDSLLQNRSVAENIVLGNFGKFRQKLLMKKIIDEKTMKYIKQLNLKKINDEKSVNSYSIGSQQKIVFAKWLFADSQVLFIDEPTMSVDVVSKIELYNLMTAMLRRQKSIIMLSSDLDELMGMCDEILIMYEGTIVKKIKTNKASKKKILFYSMGKGKND